jgi:hypothetical protein
MDWQLSHRADRRAAALADRHYTRQSVGSTQFVPPGRCLVLLTPDASALWVTSWPDARYVKHAWAGAWICTLFRNESPEKYLSSSLICDAVAATRAYFGKPPALGMVTFVDPSRVRTKRDPGWCYLRAGFRSVGTTKGGLIVLQLVPSRMPPAAVPGGATRDAFRNTLCPVCETIFLQSGRGRKRRYCSDACQQVAYRCRVHAAQGSEVGL